MSAELQAENDQLKASNRKLAQQLMGMADKLDAGRRELLATGWDACADLPSRPNKADNPYRKPAIDLSGAIVCKTGDSQ